jgi:hypothetical protein
MLGVQLVGVVQVGSEEICLDMPRWIANNLS